MKKILISLLVFSSLLTCSLQATTVDSLQTLLSTSKDEEKAAILNQLAKLYFSINLDSATDFSQKAGLLANKYQLTEELAFAKKHLGIINYYRNDTTLAQAYYDDALKLFEASGNELEASNILNNKALIYFNSNELDKAIKLHLKSLKIKERLNNSEAIILSLTNLGNCYNQLGETETAIQHFNRALEINKLISPEKIHSSLILGLGSSYFKSAKYYEALEIYNQAIIKAKQQSDYYSLVALLNNRGNVLLRLGDLEAAIQDYETAITQLDKVARTGQLPSLLLNLGNIYQQTDQNEKAKNLYRDAYTKAKMMENKQVVVRAMLNLSLMFDMLNLPDSAIYYIQKAQEMEYTSSNPELNTMTYNILSNHLLKKDKLADAALAAKKAYQLAVSHKLINEQAKASHNLGSLYFELKSYDLANNFLKESLTLNQQNGDLDLQLNNLLSLSQLHEETNNFEQALKYYQTYTVIFDSLFNIEKQQQVSQAEGRLNLKLKEEQLENQKLLIEKKNKELYLQRARISYVIVIATLLLLIIIILYNRKQIKISRNQLRLEQDQLETEHRLLRAQMNPHFMFNALNSIQSFISENNTMQAEIFLSKFARLMRYYLDSSSKSYVSLDEELAGLKLNIELEQLRMNNAFDYDIFIDEAIEAEECDVPPMLAQPFVENAIKHGLRSKVSKGLLQLKFKLISPSSMICIIQDNGIGRAAASRQSLNKTSHESLGITITKKRLANIWNEKFKHDYIKIIDLTNQSGEANGTRVEIIFPYKS